MIATLLRRVLQPRRLVLPVALLWCHSTWSQQIENPIACDEGSEPIEIQYAAHTVGCAIDLATDLDQFTFFGSAADKIRIIVLSTTFGLDPRVELRNPAGVVVADAFCNGGPGTSKCPLTVELTLSDTGTYFLAVSDAVTNEAGNYILQLERFSPIDAPQDVKYNAPILDSVDPQTDIDFFSFDGVSGTDVRVTLLSMTFGLDPRVEVADPGGNLIEDTFCNGGPGTSKCSFSIDLALTSSGKYFLAVSDSFPNESGSYEVSLQCLFGPCPAAADMSLTMTDSVDPVIAGENLDYSLIVTNGGPGNAQSVIVTTVLPPEVTFAFTTGCNEDPAGVPTCNLGEIANGGSAQFDASVTVDAGFEGTITALATVDALTSEDNAGDELAQEETVVVSNDLVFEDGFEDP